MNQLHGILSVLPADIDVIVLQLKIAIDVVWILYLNSHVNIVVGHRSKI